MRIFLSRSGFSMVQGMVISAVLAGSALIATRMFTTQKMALKTSETKDQIAELHKMIFSTLQNREYCLRTFVTPLAVVGVSGSYSVTNVKTMTGGAEEDQFVANTGSASGMTYMNGNVRINSMRLNTTGDLSEPQPFVINYMRLEGKDANGVRSKTGFGGKSISKTIYIRLQRDPSALTTINGCYAIELNTDSDTGQGNSDLNKTFCEGLGTGAGEHESLYTWDETRNTCVLRNNICDPGFVFEGIDSTGLKLCRPFADYLPYFLESGAKPCPPDKAFVNIVRDSGTGKVSIQCYGDLVP
ncbi:MAG: hypothetical protein V4598_02025 [Bdellovibrionota bacterium]